MKEFEEAALTKVGFNHIALEVLDVNRSCKFYNEILGLRPMQRPAFDFPGAWFQLGNNIELHLIGGQPLDTKLNTRSNHFAIEVRELDAWQAWLESHRIQTLGRKIRPDGALQLYITDPDGYVIELCELSTIQKA
jgi:lactoylglutathione lyase